MSTVESNAEAKEVSEINVTPPLASSSSRKAVLLSVVIVLALIGGLAGMFAATTVSEEENFQDAGEISAAAWIGDRAAIAHRKIEAGVEGYAPSNDEVASVLDAEEKLQDLVLNDALVRRGEVKKGVPVIKNLTGLGLSIGDAQQIINALDGVFDFRRARPGHKFEVRMNSTDGSPALFRYEASLADVYEVRKMNNGFKGRKVKIPTRKVLKTFGGTIASSLYKVVSDLGAHSSLAAQVADVLSTQVNFYKEQRPGDTFRVMIEEESIEGQFIGYGPVLGLEYNGVKSGKKRFFYFKPGDENATYFNQKGISIPRSAILVPLHYTRLSSPFGMRYHPVLKRKKLHNGVDFAAPRGTPVWACAEGVISVAGRRGANGNLVGINHGNGLLSFYAHLSQIKSGIKSGAKVRQKQVIGYVGSTGRSTGPHLHWGLKKNGKFLNPLKYKIRPGRPVAARYRSKLTAIIKERSRRLDRVKIHKPKQALTQVKESGQDALGLEDDF